MNKRLVMGVVGVVILLGIGAAGSATSLAGDAQSGRKYRFEYRVVVPPASRVGERLAIWVPYPVENEFQKIIRSEVFSPFPWEMRNEKKFGNRLIYIDGRTAATETKIIFRYEVERSRSSGYSKESIHKKASLDPSLYRGPDRLVPLDRQIRTIAESVTRGLKSPSEKIEALYRYVVRSMTYNGSSPLS
jgi:transglutaminase-like putative cysteine protease